MDKCDEKLLKESGMRSRVALSIITFFGLLVFLVIWLAFYAGEFSVYQNLAAIIVAILIFLAIMGSSWASWGMKYGPEMQRRYEKRPVKRVPAKRKKPRTRKRL